MEKTKTIRCFSGTQIEVRIWSKGELARRLEISPSTMTRYLKRVEPKLPGYQRSSKLLFPNHIRAFLLFYNFIEE